MPLTYAESRALRRRLDAAIMEVEERFVRDTVITSPTGVPLGGPDPRAVNAELLLAVARYLARRGLDLISADVFERRIAALETELEAVTAAAPIVQALAAKP